MVIFKKNMLGCTAPTWATPLYNLALGYARLSNYETIEDERY